MDMRWAINVSQAARTPMDKKSGNGLRNYVRKLHKSVDGMVPWEKKSKFDRLRELKDKTRSSGGEDALKASEDLAQKMGL